MSEFENLRVRMDADRSSQDLKEADQALAAAQVKLARLAKEHGSQQEERAITLDTLEDSHHEAGAAQIRPGRMSRMGKGFRPGGGGIA